MAAQMKVRYVQRAKVREVKEIFHNEHVSGAGQAAVFNRVSSGWVIGVGNGNGFFVGREKPLFQAGDFINIILEGVINNASSPASSPDDDNKDAPAGGQRDR